MFKQVMKKKICKRMEALIARCCDGECSAQEEFMLSEHLRSCAGCAVIYKSYAAMQKLLGEGTAAACPDLASPIMSIIRKTEDRSPSRAVVRVAWSIYLALAAFFAIYLLQTGDGSAGQATIEQQIVQIANFDRSKTLFANQQSLELLEGVLQ
jgi:predicted anti-sigma-YlaC factor YlaD